MDSPQPGQGARQAAAAPHVADLLRATERERLRALVAADLDAARPLHADDFQLITPAGGVLTKTQYLEGVAAGYLNYRVWEPDPDIDVRLYGPSAVIRYQARLHMSLGGAAGELRRYWHTDLYELRDGQWQVVWSQATAIA